MAESEERYNTYLKYLGQKHTVTSMAPLMGLSQQGLSRWIRDYEKRLAKEENKKSHKTRKRSRNNNLERSSCVETIHYTDEELPPYGELAPTGYISDLGINEWVDKYCEYDISEWDTEYIRDMRETLWTRKRLLLLYGRNHGKTWRCIEIWARWIADKRTPVLAILAGRERASLVFESVIAILEGDQFRRDYGDIIVKRREDKYIIKIDKSLLPKGEHLPTFRAATRGAKDIIGWHGGLIHLEDIIQEPFTNNESNKKLQSWWKRVVQGMRGYDGDKATRILVSGTTNNPYDFYNFIETESRIFKNNKKRVKSLTKHSGDWPTKADVEYDDLGGFVPRHKWKGVFTALGCPKWPIERLLAYRAEQYEEFMQNMQNDPEETTGLYFDMATDWHETSETKNYPYRDFWIFCDPAYGQSDAADNFCLLVVCIRDHTMILVDGYYQKGLTNADIKELITKYRDEYLLGLNRIWLHVDMSERYLWNDITTDLQYPELGQVTSKTKKVERINVLKSQFFKKYIQIDSLNPIINDIQREMRMYDRTESTATKKDDALDCIATAWIKLKHLILRRGSIYKDLLNNDDRFKRKRGRRY
jgi:hypothetical protein